jgi:NADH dehydrogenase
MAVAPTAAAKAFRKRAVVNVLVTGGTGFVGQVVVRELQAAGHTPRVLARSAPRTPPPPASNTVSPQWVRGNILDPQTLVSACAGTDAVVHLVGIISEQPPLTFENVHVIGTQHVLDAARACGVRRFVHMSALGARPNAPSRYHQTKWRAEEAVRTSGLDWTIFRPSIIHGPGDAFVNLFARLSRFSPVLPVIGSGTHLLQPIPVACVAQAFARALEQPAPSHQTYDLCGLRPVSMLQILDAILTATDRRRL